MDRRLDMAFAALFALAGLTIIWQATGIRFGVMRDPVGPRAAFYLCGGIMLIGGLITIFRHWRAIREERGLFAANEGTEDTEGYPAHFTRAAIIAGLCIGYGLLMDPLGYLLATPLFILAALAVMEQRRWGLNILIALIFTVTMYVIFARILGVRVSHGPLTPLLREWGWITL